MAICVILWKDWADVLSFRVSRSIGKKRDPDRHRNENQERKQ